MTLHAAGRFEITMQPAPADGERVTVGRMFIDKQYAGDLVATAQGEMLSAGNPAAGSASYVAIEHVNGTLNGRQGGFALQHAGTMHAGEHVLAIRIVPGSGTGELAGIAGTLALKIVERQHFYDIDYTLPDQA